MAFRHGNTYAAHSQFKAAAANYDNAAPYDEATDDRLGALEDEVRLDREAMLECVNETLFSASDVSNEALLQLRDAYPALRRYANGESLNSIDHEVIRGLAARAGDFYDAVEPQISKEVARRFDRRDAA